MPQTRVQKIAILSKILLILIIFLVLSTLSLYTVYKLRQRYNISAYKEPLNRAWCSTSFINQDSNHNLINSTNKINNIFTLNSTNSTLTNSYEKRRVIELSKPIFERINKSDRVLFIFRQ